jgi:hypothetical protein
MIFLSNAQSRKFIAEVYETTKCNNLLFQLLTQPWILLSCLNLELQDNNIRSVFYLIYFLFSFDRGIRVEKTLMQTLASQLSSISQMKNFP